MIVRINKYSRVLPFQLETITKRSVFFYEKNMSQRGLRTWFMSLKTVIGKLNYCLERIDWTMIIKQKPLQACIYSLALFILFTNMYLPTGNNMVADLLSSVPSFLQSLYFSAQACSITTFSKHLLTSTFQYAEHKISYTF
jgi:hypothetical protein